jgi:hypothetical protein
MNRITTTSRADDPRHGQYPPSDAAQRDGRPMLRIRSNVVIPSILHHVRHLSFRYPTVGMIDEQMLAVVPVPNRVASRSHERPVYIACIYKSTGDYAAFLILYSGGAENCVKATSYPPISTGINAGHPGRHTDHTA